MFGKVFGGPLVQLVEHDRERLVFRSKRKLKVGQDTYLKVAGQLGKPAKIKGEITACRALTGGGFVCTAKVSELCHQRELGRLGPYSVASETGLRQSVRHPRTLPIKWGNADATSIDVSSGGLQIESNAPLTQDEISKLILNSELSCEARVAWVKDNRAGLEFWEVDDATKILLSRFASGRAAPGAAKPKIEPAPMKSLDKLKLMGAPSYDSMD